MAKPIRKALKRTAPHATDGRTGASAAEMSRQRGMEDASEGGTLQLEEAVSDQLSAVS